MLKLLNGTHWSQWIFSSYEQQSLSFHCIFDFYNYDSWGQHNTSFSGKEKPVISGQKWFCALPNPIWHVTTTSQHHKLCLWSRWSLQYQVIDLIWRDLWANKLYEWSPRKLKCIWFTFGGISDLFGLSLNIHQSKNLCGSNSPLDKNIDKHFNLTWTTAYLVFVSLVCPPRED